MAPIQEQALAIIRRWYDSGKCHRIDQLFMDYPEFASGAAAIYREALEQHADLPSKSDIATQLVLKDHAGFAEAVLALDRSKLGAGPSSTHAHAVRATKHLASTQRAF